ncbi:MAG: putative peptidoglycan lipid flippase [Solirubrobacterales bacterium]|jgi:putative peptidoglycan lipid II flippase|nr:putative peptidoglycan lipid flippase [Solirubrobacterales bacterium]
MTDESHDDHFGEPPAPPGVFDPSTQEFRAIRPEDEEEVERIETARESIGMFETGEFMAIPAPVPARPFEPPEWDEGNKPRGRGGRLARSTAFFSLATSASRIAGLVREVFAASYFGVKGPMSAFTIAFQVPNLVRSLFADAAIQAAFVPVFTEQLEKGNKKEAFRLASTLLFAVTMVLGAITAIFILAAPVIMPIFAPGFEGEIKHLTIVLSQILFPILIMLGATGMVVGVLNSYDRFAAFAISPFFWNVAIIVVLVLLAPHFHGDNKIYAYAIGVLVGTAIQLAIPAWDIRHTPFRFKFEFAWTKEVRRVLLLMLPVTISLGLINFNLLINSFFGTLVSDEAPAAIDKAFRIYMLPQGIFSVAVSTVVFPTLARFAARGAYDDLRRTMANGMRMIVLLLVPAAASILVLSTPMIRLVYQRGEFDAAQTHLVAIALFWFAFSLPFNGLFLLQTRTFFSLQRPWIPTAISGGNLVITALVALALYSSAGIGGIVAATAIATAASVAAQALVLRRHLGGIELGRFIDTALRVLFASAILAGVSYLIWSGLDSALGRSLLAQAISMTAALSAGAAVYLGAAKALRIPEIDQLINVVRRR